ncbi:hypothetical protein Rs2_49854 [Raphanus sativus]|nr:hypothetical protein Rs2_49854 [Raphanus sativus]
MSLEEEEKDSEETLEHTLLVVREVSVCKIPPRTTSGGYKCGEWLQSDKIWSGRLRVVSCKDRCEIRLEDSSSGDLFGACFVDPERRENSVAGFVEVFRAENRRRAWEVRVHRARRGTRRSISILKEGETIRINVKPKPTTNGTGMLSAALSGNGKSKPLPLAPPPTAATKTRNDPLSDLSHLKNNLPSTQGPGPIKSAGAASGWAAFRSHGKSKVPASSSSDLRGRDIRGRDTRVETDGKHQSELFYIYNLETARKMAAKDPATTSDDAIRVSGMEFCYEADDPIFFDFNLELPAGSRCLLVGANGSGKTTLLKILAGKHMVGGKNVVQVLSRSAFHDTQLICSGDLSYLGGSWSKTVGSAGEVPLQGDFSAEHMIFGVEGIDPVRREKLIDLLDINLQWRMHKVSDGQKRRVQICMGLLHPFKVLLLDEVTVDLDVVARMDLLEFFKEECDQRGATIVYATHIFDGLETWATHLAYIQNGELNRSSKMADINEMKTSPNLLSVVESWLRSETKLVKKKKKKEPVAAWKPSPFDNSPFRSSRHMAYYR